MKFCPILAICILYTLTACTYKRNITAENIRLSSLYTTGMVLQTIPNTVIKGYAGPGSVLGVRIMEYVRLVSADSMGKWEAVFPRIVFKKPFDLIIEGLDTTITIREVRAGEVMLFLGDARLNTLNSNQQIKCNSEDSLSNSSTRILVHKFTKNPAGNFDHTVKWISAHNTFHSYKTCSVLNWAYELTGKSRVPAGVIDATWPGAKIDAWLNIDPNEISSDSVVINSQSIEMNPYFNNVLADSIELLKNTSYKGIMAGVSRIWYNDDSWRETNLPVDFSGITVPPVKKIIYLRKKIYIPSRYLTSELRINLGYIEGDAEFYFNQQIIRPDITDGQYALTIPDTLLHEWSNLLCIRLFCSDDHSGLFGPVFDCHNADSSFHDFINREWKFNYELESDFPDFYTVTSEKGILYKTLIEDLVGYPIGEIIWYGGYCDIENPEAIAEKIGNILGYFGNIRRQTILFTPYTSLDTIIYGNNTDILKLELKKASNIRDAKWIEYSFSK